MTRFTPKDAYTLWCDPKWVGRACQVFTHPAYQQGRQTTRAFGIVMVDELSSLGGIEGLIDTVAHLVSLPLDEFVRRVPAVELKKVPKKQIPTDEDAGDDAVRAETAKSVEQRPIVVPPLLRRALSVHLSTILDVTGDELIPEVAIAYRPGRREVVQKAILDVARAVRGGCQYWAKLDVKSFFPSVPWIGIRESLTNLGYPNEFMVRAMALVQGTISVRAAWRTWMPIENTSGTQAGLRESSILANLFLANLDRHLLTSFGTEIFYRRYSDDLLIMGKTKKVVRRAVVEVDNWIEGHGLALKRVCA